MTTPEAEDARDEIQKAIRVLTYATIGLFIVLIIVIVVGFVVIAKQGSDLRAETDSTNAALCSFKNDLQSRVDQTETYLADHPEGFPGVPKGSLEASLKGQQSTLKSLSQLDCPK